MGELSAWHWAVVVLVAVLLFGSQRLPDAARSIGRSARILKAELRPDSSTPADPGTPAHPSTSVAPSAPAAPGAPPAPGDAPDRT